MTTIQQIRDMIAEFRSTASDDEKLLLCEVLEAEASEGCSPDAVEDWIELQPTEKMSRTSWRMSQDASQWGDISLFMFRRKDGTWWWAVRATDGSKILRHLSQGGQLKTATDCRVAMARWGYVPSVGPWDY